MSFDPVPEYEQIIKEYSTYFDSISIIDVDDYKSLKIVTLKEGALIVQVIERGWFETTRSEYYPTFEALLSDISPEFLVRWKEEVNKKLFAL